MKFCKYIIIIALSSIYLNSLAQELIISEVVASNATGLTDSDGSTPDWIEIYNPGSLAANLTEYSISDYSSKANKWNFPDQVIAPGEYLLLFAIGDDAELVTPSFYETVLDIGDEMKYLLPKANVNVNWNTQGFDDSGWLTGKNSFGYGDNDDTTIISPNVSVFLRKEFEIDNLLSIKSCFLHMDYDDGFVAYINGIEIARSGIGTIGIQPAYDEFASGHEAQMYLGGEPDEFEINNIASILSIGTNVIAIQVHNTSSTSSDLSAIPFLTFDYENEPANSRGTSSYLNFSNNLGANGLYVNFKINSKTDSIFLYKQNNLIDHLAINNLSTDISLGRIANNTDTAYFFLEPTPGLPNTTTIYASRTLPKPDFSHKEGVYQEGFQLNITTNEYASVIRYTTDGSEPTETSPPFSGGINININRNVRARLFKENYLPGKTRTESYLILDKEQNLPIVSITVDPANFFDYNIGIYERGPNASNDFPYFGANFWQDWEKPVHLELFETNGSTAFSVNAGVKITGNYSRGNDQKSLAFFARNQYGDKIINYQFFKDKPIKKFEAFLLRNSGNDFNNTMMRDGMITSLARNMGLDRMAFRPAIVYINAEYWGIQNLREKPNEHFIAHNHGLSPDSISILEGQGSIVHGTNSNYSSLYSFMATNDLSMQANYNIVTNDLDIQNCINYYITQMYVVNEDWPGNNIKYWRENNVNGRWRFILFDTDFGFGIWDKYKVSRNMLNFTAEPNGPGWPNPPWSTLTFRKLIENEEFKNQFINSMADRLNTTFSTDSVLSHIDSIHDIIVEEIPAHLTRWSGSLSYFNSNIADMRYFAESRPNYVWQNFRNYFSISGNYLLNLSLSDENPGRIQLNSIELDKFPWSGIYFNDIPITLKAIPKPGYQFVRWEGGTSSTENTITISSASDINLTAVFEYDETIAPEITITEINYNSSNEHDTEDWIEIHNNKSTPQDLSGWRIKDSRYYNSYEFPQNTEIPANSFWVICKDSLKFSGLHPTISNYIGQLDFNLGESDETISIFDTLPNLIDKVSYADYSWWPKKADGYGYTLQLNSLQDNNEIATSWNASALYGTPGSANTAVNQNPDRFYLVINEINYNSHDDWNSGDWFEIYNNGNSSIDISEWVLNDNEDNDIFIVPQNTTIDANSYMVFIKSPSKFESVYPEISDTIDINFGLSSKGDMIRLYDQYESLVDSVNYSPSSPWPVKANGAGYTLALNSPDLGNSLAINWNDHKILGTPAAKNFIDSTLLSTNQLFENKTMVYPTICTNQFTIDPTSASHVSIYDLSGKLVDSFKIQAKTEYLTGKLENGLYIVKIWNKEAIKSFKIIKK